MEELSQAEVEPVPARAACAQRPASRGAGSAPTGPKVRMNSVTLAGLAGGSAAWGTPLHSAHFQKANASLQGSEANGGLGASIDASATVSAGVMGFGEGAAVGSCVGDGLGVLMNPSGNSRWIWMSWPCT
ncbi:hypothetical protein AAFF_G00191060 [Aldrovandia affinis]|uniref:Uncharacterized protein n=1 Tax=Aldrovandia affinis TaxID=143900 RepID=A0AAD7W719_9TELE|nr:hypothetical protein AAFF_G00191060 [Aldrovandia affinis]